MKKICICGHFGGNNSFFDGQTVKTKNIYSTLVRRYGEKDIFIIDTYKWKSHPVTFFVKCLNGIRFSENVIMLPAHNGVKVFVPLFNILNKLYHRKVIYIVIGGWLPNFLKNRRLLKIGIKKLSKVLVETTKMKKDLYDLGIYNVDILVNFKDNSAINFKDLKYNHNVPYKICTFSRVMKEKGIEDAINVIKNINQSFGKVMYTLDIYGALDKEYIEEFNRIKDTLPDYIKYKGCVSSSKAPEIIKDYYILLFPTKFRTEGIPGTVIDSLFAGVPVVASKWDNFEDILIDGKNSYLYDMYDVDALQDILIHLLNEDYVLSIKKFTLESSYKFEKSKAEKVLFKYVESNNVDLETKNNE